MPKTLQPCGTPAAYKRHKRQNEPVDDACRDAQNAYNRDHKNKAGYNRARTRALDRLKKAYPGEFRRYYTEELAREALRTDGGEGR